MNDEACTRVLTEPNVVLPFLQRVYESLDCLLYILQSHHAKQLAVSALQLTLTGEKRDAGCARTH